MSEAAIYFLDSFPDDIELALQFLLRQIGTQQDLFHIGFSLSGNLPNDTVVSGDLPESDQADALITDNLDQCFFTLFCFCGILWQKYQSGPKLALVWNRVALHQVEIPGDLDHHTGTVARFAVSPFGTPVGHIHQGFQSPLNDIVGFLSFQMRHKPDSTIIMFKCASI